MPADLSALAFLRLRQRFFGADGQPTPFQLREKRNTQDDPFDEHLAGSVLAGLKGITCIQAPGPLITPDMVLHRSDGPIDRADDPKQIVGIEVKKLERTPQGSVARRSGVDFNTTPPCGRIRVYDVEENPHDVRGFYLFVCLESHGSNESILTALALVDGNVLNEDFNLYLSITGERTKRVGLGTYADGADRIRPMLIFSNPLGIPQLDRTATLVHGDHDLSKSYGELALVYSLKRSVAGGKLRIFSCYRKKRDAPSGPVQELVDPFPTPKREETTRPRGRFTLPFRL